MRRAMMVAALAALLATSARAAAPPTPPTRKATEAELAWMAKVVVRLPQAIKEGDFAEAQRLAGAVAALAEQVQGRDHWHTREMRQHHERWGRLAKLPKKDQAEVARAIDLDSRASELVKQAEHRAAEKLLRQALATFLRVLGERHAETARCYNSLAFALDAQGKVDDALALYRKALDLIRKEVGDSHPLTALGHNNLAGCLMMHGRYAEALPSCEKSLEILRETAGETHPDTALAYANLGSCLLALGRPAEALPLSQKALATFRKSRGARHRDTAQGLNNVGGCLCALGRPADAFPLALEALAIRHELAGESHPETAESYALLGYCLAMQGRRAEALPRLEKSLAIRVKAQGEAHPDTAQAYDAVASCLRMMGKHADALPRSRKALAARLKALGEGHPDTAGSYAAVAYCLQGLEKYREAVPLLEKAHAILAKALGEDHPDTAGTYEHIAASHIGLGNYAEALPLVERTLRVRRAVLGEDHPNTAVSLSDKAFVLWMVGRRSEAVRLWQLTQPLQEARRAGTARAGFDRAQATPRGGSPHASLAVGLASLGQPANAFRHAELSLARGLLDDLAAPSGEDEARARDLHGRLDALDAALVSFFGRATLSAADRARRDQTLREQREVASRLARLRAEMSARQVEPLRRIQEAIPVDTALVFWVDSELLKERWGCVVRREGVPAWERVRGSGKEGAWTEADSGRLAALYELLRDPASAAEARKKHLDAFAEQRFGPLRRHLGATKTLPAVKRLFVVPSGSLAYVPAEVLTDEFAVSYVPSGSVLARLARKHRAVDGSSLLAVGDPAFDRAPPAEPPSSGVFIKSVLPDGQAARAGLRTGDVLLSVGSVSVDSLDDLKAALEQVPARARYWRDGQTLSARVGGAPLGAVLDERSARAAVRAWRREQEAVARRGTGHKRLPGTRAEVEAIAALAKGSTKLLGSEASEQRLDELREEGKIKGYRILHLATHGEADDAIPGQSALILAQDRLPDPAGQARRGKKVYDGRLTVSAIRSGWELDCDLVVLSACQTGLGKYAQGDGLLGFSQAFLSRGARSVVLSRWKVDDGATALLMVRFYENLLGSRKGTKPLGRAAALDGAKRWLRMLPREEAERLAALHAGGVLRGSEAPLKPAGKAKPVQLKGERPYAHPFYWAAFTLIGDPD